MSERKLCTSCDHFWQGWCHREVLRSSVVTGNTSYVIRECEAERYGATWFGLIDRCGLDAKYFEPRKPRNYGTPPNEGSSRIPPPSSNH